MPPFSVHGDIRVEASGPLTRLYLVGPWNREAVIQSSQEIAAARAHLPPQPTALMVVTLHSALCGPDALEEIRKAVQKQSVNQLRRATAWVMAPDVEGRLVMSIAIQKVYADVNALQVFDNEAEAEQWLLAKLAEAGA